MELRDSLLLGSTELNRALDSLSAPELAHWSRAFLAASDPSLSQMSPERLYEEIVGRTRLAFRSEFSALVLNTPEVDGLRLAASSGLRAAVEGIVIPYGASIAGKMAVRKTLEPVCVDVAAEESEPFPALEGVRQMMVAPLSVGDWMLGCLGVGEYGERIYRAEELTLLQALADRYAVVLHQRRGAAWWEAEGQRRGEESKHTLSGESAFDSLFEHLEDYAILLLDPSGKVMTWNRGAERTLGYKAEEIIGQNVQLFHTAEGRRNGSWVRSLRIAAEEGHFEESDWRTRKDGTRFWANVVVSAIRGATGEIGGYIKLMRDLTEKHRVREEREMLLQKEHLARQSAEEASRAKSDFLSIISHELRTPLTAVMGYAEILRMGIPVPLPSALEEHVDRIEAAARQQLEIIEGILSFSRMQNGQEHISLSRVDFQEIVEDAVLFIRPIAEKKRLQLLVETTEQDTMFWTDRGKVRQILLHLLSNAVNFTREGHVRVAVRARIESLCVFISDTGIGLSEKEVKKVFDPFWQAEPAMTRKVGGMGLGLAIARQTAHMLQGDLRVKSEEGVGSTFMLTLPKDPRFDEAQ